MFERAAFYVQIESIMVALSQCRHALAAELCGEAAVAAARLFGSDSLITAWLRRSQASSLMNQAAAEAWSAQLLRRAVVPLRLVVWPVVTARLNGGTLLPGRCRKDEVEFAVHAQQEGRRAQSMPALDAEALRVGAATAIGYETALYAANATLALLSSPHVSAADRSAGQAFVVAVLALIPQTAAVLFQMSSEDLIVNSIETRMNPRKYDLAFCAAVLAVWRSPEVVCVLRSRGALQFGVATTEASDAAFEARRLATAVEWGLKPCGLPECGKKEVTVSQFKSCPLCMAVKYCCPEHQLAHWQAGHSHYCSRRFKE